ncbi:MAG: arginine repressor [Gemmatimonadetes bacterium]|nr:arginine repressor [Gemmatimonadota bacterium]MYB59914.1 arginine repressor [Gemmatimonadota bacterium]
MNAKHQRQGTIRSLIERGHFHTHKEVIAALHTEGIDVNQGTLSKDFKELHVIKTRLADGQYKYVLPRYYSVETQDELVEREIRDFVVSADDAMNQVVLQTSAGHASGVCEAIDQAEWPEIVGSVAGENTILLITKSTAHAGKTLRRIKDIMKQKRAGT